MSVNFANINISIQQFQSIASGKYNAGEFNREIVNEINAETTLRPSHLLINGNLVPFGQGNEIKGSFSLLLTEDKLNSMGNLDFTTCDNTAAEELFNSLVPVENKLIASVNLLPHPFRLNISPVTSFSVTLN